MTLRLLQLRQPDGARAVAVLQDSGDATRLTEVHSTYQLAQLAIERDTTLAELAAQYRTHELIDLASAEREGRILAPIDHPDPAHLYLSGTGLTHLGSAQGRDHMHKAQAGGAVTDSMRMFMMGVEAGKPLEGTPGVQPEWFYKGNGTALVGPGAPLASPRFALDGSEEPEIAGIYLIDRDGNPWRLGICLANEFSDHVTERGNYLWLAHSKLRPAALGPELLTGAIPADIRGRSRILREGVPIWEQPFLTGEANMSHSIANLEHHHFKYAAFRQPGDVHVHFFGTATLSFADGIKTRSGDVFEIQAAPFRCSLRNPLGAAEAPHGAVRAL